MASIADIRKQYPQYNDVSDQDLADAFHDKYYKDIPKDDYYKQIGLGAAEPQVAEPAAPAGFIDRLSGNYNAAVNEGLEGMEQGAARVVAPDASAWERTKGAGQAALGALNYVSSPINAASKTIVGDPFAQATRDLGGSEETAQMVGNSADFAGQLLGGVGMAKAVPAIARGVTATEEAAAPFVRGLKKEVAPTQQQVYRGSKDAYAVVDNSGVRVSPEPFQEFADQLGGTLKGYKSKMPKRAPETTSVLKELQNYATEEDTLKFSELAELKSDIVESISATGTNPRDKRLLRQIGDRLDNFMDNLTPDHLDTGEVEDLTKVQGALDTAKALWHKNAKMSDIEAILKIAKNRKYPDRYIQQKFTSLASNENKLARFTPEERKMIVDVSKGGSLDTISKWLAPEGDRIGGMKAIINATAGAGAGGALFGLPGVVGAAAPAAIGYGAKAITESSRLAKIKALQDTIALGRQPRTYLERVAAERAIARSRRKTP